MQPKWKYADLIARYADIVSPSLLRTWSSSTSLCQGVQGVPVVQLQCTSCTVRCRWESLMQDPGRPCGWLVSLCSTTCWRQPSLVLTWLLHPSCSVCTRRYASLVMQGSEVGCNHETLCSERVAQISPAGLACKQLVRVVCIRQAS